ncbi:MAG TPA: transposase [Verrucomicrobiota bacterium]|nr:transposase [Verrucomicrobiota bacterium]HRZ55415.1 transposase [Candidatus Paceibacterota bacterium]
MKRQLPSQILEQQFFSLAARRAALSESIQLGAQLMLQKAVELEVTEFPGREHYGRSGDEPLRAYRNGYEDQQVQTAEGPLHLKMPQVRDTIEEFESVWLRALVRRSDKLPEKARPWLKRLLQKAFTAATYKKGFEQAQGIVATYREQFPEAMKCLATDLEEVLTALRFPESHRKRIRLRTCWSVCSERGSVERRSSLGS